MPCVWKKSNRKLAYHDMKENYYIGVLGGANPPEKFLKIAYEVGELLAKNNVTVLCGGLSGVMKEVSKYSYVIVLFHIMIC